MTHPAKFRRSGTSVADVLDPHDRRVIDLGTALIEAAMDDASIVADIPRGATLVLLPDDDPSFVEQAIVTGLDAVRAGRDVYFRHVRSDASEVGGAVTGTAP